MLTAAGEAALAGLVALERASGEATGALPLSVVATRARVAAPRLAKAFQALTKARILEARRGPGGGYALARPADAITILDVASAVNGSSREESCVLEGVACDDDAPCLLCEMRSRQSGALTTEMSALTIADLSRRGRAGRRAT